MEKLFEIGEIIDYFVLFRKVKKWNQKDLAEKFNCSQSKISAIETGRNAVGLDELAGYAKAFELEITFTKDGKIRLRGQSLI